jgi:hypothetical protein
MKARADMREDRDTSVPYYKNKHRIHNRKIPKKSPALTNIEEVLQDETTKSHRFSEGPPNPPSSSLPGTSKPTDALLYAELAHFLEHDSEYALGDLSWDDASFIGEMEKTLDEK